MPLPKPTDEENESDFIGRCMGDSTSKEEFPDTKQRVAVCVDIYRKEKRTDAQLNDQVSDSVSKGLQNKLKEHKEKVGDDKRKQTTLRKLKIVYNRGIGAWKTNPSSVRPSVSSPEQWAMARVNSFLYALRNLRFRSGKHDTDLLPESHPLKTKEKLDSHRHYEDGEAIPSALPPAYRKSRKDGETKGQACVNCKFWKEDVAGHRYYCTKWKAPVRGQYWCKAWKPMAKALEETYNDYPESATNNAKKVLRWRDEHKDEVKGMTATGWRRANQLANREKISRDTIARMASFKRHQKNAEIDPKFKSTPWKDRGYVAWLGWGGTSGIEWAIKKRKQIDKQKESKMSSKKYGFSILNISESRIDKEERKMFGVSLIQVGEALGHELFVDDNSLDTILESLGKDRLPAYITHSGALFSDRLTKEIGMFTNFRKEEDRILADFEAFESFREDDAKQFNRLFEMAEKMPERFGLSIVFSATQVWATKDGDVEASDKPSNALFNYPSIRVQEVTSADFVDSPASNSKGLFSKNNLSIKMEKLISEATEALEAQEAKEETLEAQEATEETQEVQLSEETEALGRIDNEKTINQDSQGLEEHSEEETELEGHEDELGGHDEEESLEDKLAKLESLLNELSEKLDEKDAKIAELEEQLGGHKEEEKQMKEKEDKMEAELSSAKAEVSKLSALIKGTTPVEVSKEEEVYQPSKSNRDRLIKEFASENKISEFSATLRLAKEKPELFKL